MFDKYAMTFQVTRRVSEAKTDAEVLAYASGYQMTDILRESNIGNCI